MSEHKPLTTAELDQLVEGMGNRIDGHLDDYGARTLLATALALRAEVERLTGERDFLAELVGQAIGLRCVDFAAGEVPHGLKSHALIEAMLATIGEREAAERQLVKARKAIPELDLITEYIREDDCGCYEEHICGKPIALRALAALRAALDEGKKGGGA